MSESPVWVTTEPGLVTPPSLTPAMNSLGLIYSPETAGLEDSGGEGAAVSQEAPGLEEEVPFTGLGTLWGQEVTGGLN